MFVEVHAADAGGCGYYRLIWPGLAVHAAGLHEVDVFIPGDRDPWLPTYIDQDGRLMGLGRRERWPDVLVFQRPLRRTLVDVIPFLQARGTAVVVELDDDFGHIDRRNVAWRADGHEREAALQDACAAADLVTVSAPRLAERYGQKHGRVRVLPNYVPARYLDVRRHRRDDDEIWVGWSGSVLTHRGDLEVVGRGVSRAVTGRASVRVRAVGTGVGVAKALGLSKKVEGSGWVDLLEAYPNEVARLDVGLAPLAQIPFNLAKSWLKPLEYAALGVAAIASRTPEYERLETVYGPNVLRLVESPRQWEGAIKALLDSDARQEQAVRARAALSTATVEAHAVDWADAWSDARRHLETGHT